MPTPTSPPIPDDTLDKFVVAYANHPVWGTIEPAAVEFELWRDRIASYMVTGEILSATTDFEVYLPATTMPCTSAAPESQCTIDASYVALLVVLVRPDEIVMLPTGVDEGIDRTLDTTIALHLAVGVTMPGDDPDAAARTMAQPLLDTLPIGATITSLVDTQMLDTGARDYGLQAGFWSLVDADGTLHTARRPEWPATAGFLKFDDVASARAAAQVASAPAG